MASVISERHTEATLREPFRTAHHRLFVIFDNLEDEAQALAALAAEGYTDEDDVWIFYGLEGVRQFDLEGRSHGVRAKVLRLLQRAVSNDFEYLQGLDEALHQGRVVLAVHVSGPAAADGVAKVLRPHGGRAFAYCAHWDFSPIAV